MNETEKRVKIRDPRANNTPRHCRSIAVEFVNRIMAECGSEENAWVIFEETIYLFVVSTGTTLEESGEHCAELFKTVIQRMPPDSENPFVLERMGTKSSAI